MGVETAILLNLLRFRRILIGEIASTTGASTERIMEVLEKNIDTLRISGEEVILVDPIKLALRLASKNTSLRRISEYLDWRDFEAFASRILQESGYEIEKGLKLTTPVRFEIDIFGVEETTGFSVAIDCKHWSTMSRARIIQAAQDHLERLEKFTRYYDALKHRYRIIAKSREILPLILTLFKPPLRVYESVLFISIEEFPELLRNRHIVLDYYEISPIKVKHNF